MKIRTNYSNYDPSRYIEDVDSSSETVPDQSLTVQDILRRFQNGTITNEELYRQGFYDDNPDIDSEEIYAEDLTDIDAAKAETFSRIDRALKQSAAEREARLQESSEADELKE